MVQKFVAFFPCSIYYIYMVLVLKSFIQKPDILFFDLKI